MAGNVTIKGRIQFPRFAEADLAAVNPVLLDGEVVYESSTGRRKMGDGVKTWNSLPYEDELKDNAQHNASSLTVAGGNQYEYTGSAALTVQINASILNGDVLIVVPAAVSVTFSNAAAAALTLLKEESLLTLSATSGKKVYTIHAVKATNASKAWVFVNGAVYM